MGNLGAVVHRANDTEVIHEPGDFWKNLTHFGAALAVRREFPRRRHEISRRGELERRFWKRQRLAVEFRELGFGVERVHLRHPAMHVKEDDAFGPRRKMRGPGGERVFRRLRVRGEEPGQSHVTEVACKRAQGIAAGENSGAARVRKLRAFSDRGLFQTAARRE